MDYSPFGKEPLFELSVELLTLLEDWVWHGLWPSALRLRESEQAWYLSQIFLAMSQT